MMAGHGDDISPVGAPTLHIPVLLAEVLEALGPNTGRGVFSFSRGI